MEETTQHPKQVERPKTKDIAPGIVGGLILMGVGGIFLLDSLDILEMNVAWPLILIVVGAAILTGSLLKRL